MALLRVRTVVPVQKDVRDCVGGVKILIGRGKV